MNQNNRKDELLSRRDFFRYTAKFALPVVGTIILSSTPIIANAVNRTPMGCIRTFYGECKNACKGGCQYTCTGTCNMKCVDTCSDKCVNTCKTLCAIGCTNGCIKNFNFIINTLCQI